jgi:hypothetical protein
LRQQTQRELARIIQTAPTKETSGRVQRVGTGHIVRQPRGLP